MNHSLDRFGCVANTLKVAAGHYVDLVNPDPDSIDITSIGIALSNTCRFGGHCPVFYSVAEHSVLATMLARSDGISNDGLRAILLHDAAEAYVGDMVKPLKVHLPDFQQAEQRITDAIDRAFGLDFDHWEPTIKRYDRAMLKAEKIAMWPEDKERWEGFGDDPPRSVQFQYFGPFAMRGVFLSMAENLGLVSMPRTEP